MSRFHINPQTGDPGRCSAKKQCPFGGGDREHYDSKKLARQAYEKHMSEGTIPSIVITPKNLETMATSTDKVSEMNIVMKHGHWVDKMELAKNPNATPEILARIHETAENDTVKAVVAMNPNTPFRLIDREGFVAIRSLDKISGNKRIQDRLRESDEVTDKHADAIIDMNLEGVFGVAILTNHKAKLSQENYRKIALANTRNLQFALENPNIDINGLLNDGSYSGQNLQDLMQIRPTEKLRQFIYNHVNCPPETKERLERSSPHEFPI